MAQKKQPAKSSKTTKSKGKTMAELRRKHPFETDSQIQNRYGNGREHPGSDSTPGQEGRGSNH